jgi:hypothetical protein
MKSLAALMFFLLSVWFDEGAYAQVYVDETSNLGNFFRLAGTSPFDFVDEFQSSGNTWTIAVVGQNGKGGCSGRGCTPPTYQTLIASPALYTAQVASPDWVEVSPALDANSVPIVFTCISASSCTAWSWSGELPAGSYALHFTGTSCGGVGCKLLGQSHVWVTTTVH